MGAVEVHEMEEISDTEVGCSCGWVSDCTDPFDKFESHCDQVFEQRCEAGL